MKINTEQIEEAISLVEDAMQLVQDAIAGTSVEAHFEAYGRYGFNQLLGNGNPYDASLHTLVEEADEEEE